MSDPDQDELYMRRALSLARRGWGQTHPNPMVGAVVVENGKVVGEGWHARDGGPHAERVALDSVPGELSGTATLYVTLEPCSTAGRTGACCDAILAAGVKRVVVGAIDPNPVHVGGGVEKLRAAGVEVETGVCDEACEDLNLIFNHWITKDVPLLAAKTAVSLDGRIACRSGDSRWITNELSRADVHHWRGLFPAIAAGAMTVMTDNPRLTIRTEGQEEQCPWRFVFDGLLRTVNHRSMPSVYTDEFKERTIVVTTPHGGLGYVRQLENMGVNVWVLPSDTQRVKFSDFRQRCAEEKITGVYFEGGALLVSDMLRAQELDYLFSYRSPVLMADDRAKGGLSGLRPDRLSETVRLREVQHANFGEDQLMRGWVQYPDRMQLDETLFMKS